MPRINDAPRESPDGLFLTEEVLSNLRNKFGRHLSITSKLFLGLDEVTVTEGSIALTIYMENPDLHQGARNS